MTAKILIVLDNLKEKTLLRIEDLLLLNVPIDVLSLGIPTASLKRKLSNPIINCLEFTRDEYNQLKTESVNFYVSLPWNIYSHKDFEGQFDEDYWLMPHTEKSLWASDLCNQLYYKLLLKKADTVLYEEVIYLTDTVEKNQYQFSKILILKSLVVESIKFFCRLCLVNVFFPFKKNLPAIKENLLITLYPEWFQFKENNKTNDMFFSDLVNPLEDGSKWDVLLIPYPLRTLYKTLQKDRSRLQSSRLHFLENYSKARDVFKILNIHFIMKNLKVLSKIKRWKNEFELESMDVTPLVQQDLLRSFYNGGFFCNILWKESFKRLQVKNYKRCFYRMEFQPFENSFLLPLQDKVSFVGFQHSIFGPHFLNYIFPQNIFNRDDKYKLPLPNKIIATGNSVKQQLINAGVKAEVFQMVGAFRFNRLFSFNREKRDSLREELKLSSDVFMVFMPVSQLLSENLTMIEELSSALVNSNLKYHFFLKINPNKKYDLEFLKSIEDAFGQIKEKHNVNIFIEDSRYYEFILAADCLYLSGGSASVEALLLGTTSILFDAPNLLNHNPMAAYFKTFLVVESSEDIKKALDAIQKKTFHIDPQEKNKLLEDIFANITLEGRKAFEDIISGEKDD
ncbi:MAG: hypothetical protein WC635_16105 [Bacteriovorax sp.]